MVPKISTRKKPFYGIATVVQGHSFPLVARMAFLRSFFLMV
jgi:hypothetical protein